MKEKMLRMYANFYHTSQMMPNQIDNTLEK